LNVSTYIFPNSFKGVFNTNFLLNVSNYIFPNSFKGVFIVEYQWGGGDFPNIFKGFFILEYQWQVEKLSYHILV